MYKKAIRPGTSKPVKRDPDDSDDDFIDISRSIHSTKRQNAEAGPSRSKTPIVIDSDEEEEALRIERIYVDEDRERSPKRQRIKDEDVSGDMDQFQAREAVRAALSKLSNEMKDVQAQIEPLQALLVSLQAEKRDLESQLSSLHTTSSSGLTTRKPHSAPARTGTGIDYQSSTFPWSSSLLITLKKTFDIPSFRLCQEGVVNAAIDGRDIVCVMPTGGGKSLTYQLPAVLGKRGLTVVISPLLALIWDQVRAMKEIGVESVMLTGSTSKEEQNDIYRRLEKGESNGEKEIRLCYLTPEKVSKSKRLMSVLEKAHAAGRLRRFVIDEAHCCSQLGHDFRPDYKKLSVLKTLFPRVPIQAVTATLSTKTLPDLLKILRLAPICDGRQANTNGTVFFTAPLYRPNLHYKVLDKPSSAKATVGVMGKWIQEHHAGQSGIIYCLSKKDAEVVADSLREWSSGRIKTGVYHAGIDDYEKERIHVNWRKGKINCICATIAFGLGIDKCDVRYVIHHSVSKSLDGYYQETGRAGRDGKDSDCVLFYRGQDASRLASLIYGDTDGSSKLREMTRFAHDLTTCRKVAFAKHFSTSANLSANAWDTAATLTSSSTAGSLTTCGICDNCTRDESAVVTKDVTLDAWRIVKILQAVDREDGRVTVGAAADLVRGLGGGHFPVVQGRKSKVTGKTTLDLATVAGAKVGLSKDDTERLIIHLILSGYVREYYTATAYAVNVYLQPAQEKSVRLTRLTQQQVEEGQSVKIVCTFLSAVKRGRGGKTKGKKEVVDIGIEDLSDEGEGESIMEALEQDENCDWPLDD